MRFVSIVLLVLMALPVLAQGWDKEPTSFANIAFGADKALAEQVLEKTFRQVPSLTYVVEHEIVTANHTLKCLFLSVFGKFEGVTGSFKQSEFDFWLDVFKRKYGEPTSVETPTLYNLAGAKVDNDVALWRGNNVIIRLSRYGGDFENSSLSISTQALREVLKQREQREIEDALSQF